MSKIQYLPLALNSSVEETGTRSLLTQCSEPWMPGELSHGGDGERLGCSRVRVISSCKRRGDAVHAAMQGPDPASGVRHSLPICPNVVC